MSGAHPRMEAVSLRLPRFSSFHAYLSLPFPGARKAHGAGKAAIFMLHQDWKTAESLLSRLRVGEGFSLLIEISQ